MNSFWTSQASIFTKKNISYCGDKAILVCEFRLKDLVLKSIWRKYLVLSDRILLQFHLSLPYMYMAFVVNERLFIKLEL